MVSASSPEAAMAGAVVLRAGGNAADAAVAAAFALSVTDISQTGLGGGGSLLWYDARRARAEHLLFYPRTGADPAWGVRDTMRAPLSAGRMTAVPGMVAGLVETHRRYGRLPLAQVMAPAIRLAREGFTVTPLLSRTIASARARIDGDPAVVALLFPGGEPLRPGDRLTQSLLAQTLERIAAEGESAFYEGAIAERLAAKVQGAGGLIRAPDLSGFPVERTDPLCADWRGLTVLAAPPPVGGAPVLAMLQLAEGVGIARDAGPRNTGASTARASSLTADPQGVATLAGVLRTVQSDAQRWRGDPRVMAVPARGFASAGYARARAATASGPVVDTVPIGNPWPFERDVAPSQCVAYAFPAAQPDDEQPKPPQGAHDATESFTSHLAVVDAEGNAVSVTTTVGLLFGSGLYTDGFFLNSSGANLDDRTRGPNRVTNSTIAPTLVLEGRKVRLVIGAAGSQYIQPAVAQVALRIVAFGEDPGAAISAPRIQTSPVGRDVEVEPGFPPAVYAELAARGYRPLSRVADIQFGGVHGIAVRRDGLRIGIADPRRDGVAVRE